MVIVGRRRHFYRGHVPAPPQRPTPPDPWARLANDLADRGFVPVPVDLSELLLGGGGPKCCTLEVRP